jgi:ATP-dependent Clp protease adapter protein ClpS
MSSPPDSTPLFSDLPFPRPDGRPNGELPRCRVVLLNNAGQDLMFVVRTIMELTRLCRAEATHKMWEAHHSGRAQVLITHRERAELYALQFVERGLQVVVEPL